MLNQMKNVRETLGLNKDVTGYMTRSLEAKIRDGGYIALIRSRRREGCENDE